MKKQVKSIGDLLGTDAQYNPREIEEDDLIRLQQTMREFGDLGGIVLNVRTGTLVGGHQRKKVLDPSWNIVKEDVTDSTGTVAMGTVVTPFGRFQYREVDWDEDKEKAANLVANHSAGRWNFEKKNEIVLDLQHRNFDLTKLGRPDREIEQILAYHQHDTPEKPEHTKLKEERENPGTYSAEEKITVKVNLELYHIQFLDEKYGKGRRSEGVRDAVEYMIDTWEDHSDE